MIIGEKLAGYRLAARIRRIENVRIVAASAVLCDTWQGETPMWIEKWQDIPYYLEKCRANRLYATMSERDEKQRQELERWCREANCTLCTEPSAYEAESRKTRVLQTAQEHMEVLLNRKTIQLSSEAQSQITGKTVLVTGAGGTIGSEISRVLAECRPKQMILLDIAEHDSLQIRKEIAPLADNAISVIGSVTNERLMEQVFATYRPQVVFHAAAHKHVPLMETNLSQCIENNVFGTACCARTAARFGAEAFVLISTDKAAEPVSVMGKAKRICEIMMRLMNETAETKFRTVRFGNVIGSSGSVLTEFAEQIAYGGPVMLTEEGMTRFFMTAHEAAQLVISAAFLQENAQMYMLDMGEAVSIATLAKRLLKLLGREDIAIVSTGRRAGEKLTEQLYTAEETVCRNREAHIYSVQDGAVFRREIWFAVLEQLREALFADEKAVRALMQTLVEETELR